MVTPVEALDHLRALASGGELATFCDEHHIDLLVAFGSATESTDPGLRTVNDLDVAVLLGREPDGPWGLGGLVAALMTLLRLSEVDVMDLGRAGVIARSNALGTGEPLFERHAGTFAREQMRAVGQRMEQGWLTDLALSVLAAP